jgi:diguanylate cyclase (GGDEF)-like protein/PAS domain S-box-containing protein
MRGIALSSLPRIRLGRKVPCFFLMAVPRPSVPFSTWCEMQNKSLLNLKVRLACGSAILTLLVVGAMSYRGTVVYKESDLWVRHTHEVLERLGNLLSAMQSIESGARGYLLTGKLSYLDSYRANIVRAQQEESAVRDLTLDNPTQQGQISNLDRITAEKLRLIDGVISLRQTQGLPAAAEVVTNGTGQQVMDEYREVIREMQNEEQRLLILRDRDAARRLAQARAILILGVVLGVVVAFAAGWSVERDSVRRGIAEDALFEEKERAQVTLNSIGDAVICTDIVGRISFLNRVAEKMTGWPWQEAVGLPMADVLRILDATSRETTPNPMELAVGQNQTTSLPLNCLLIRRDGFETPIEDSVSPIHDREKRVTGAVIVFRDVSAARAMALEMTHSAQHDFLTGLPNRMLLNDRIDQAIVLASRHTKKVAVLFLDLDGFKHINDSLGHAIGDKLLQSVAKRLVDCVRGSDTVSRQGGDEFVILLSEVEHAEDGALSARRMLEAVALAHSIDQHDLHVTASIGLSVYPDDGMDAETLVKNADTAMYQAKENGRQGYKFFKPAMNVRAVERQSIEESLRRAVERREFALHYQPKINLKTGEITGAEALVRWTHPTRGPVSPAEFIPVAEDCGLIVPIGNWVLREACQQARSWIEAGLPATTMAVNISAIEFRDERFLNGVFAALDDTGLDPKSLELELTESVLMTRAESTTAILQALRARGVKVAVDDFGTGYSSLSYLRKFPVDALKIDQSFIRQITISPAETTIVAAIISMGRSLDLRVVAEGVETHEELAFLQARQCDEAQGYYFSRAILPREFATLLETGLAFRRLFQYGPSPDPALLERVPNS